MQKELDYDNPPLLSILQRLGGEQPHIHLEPAISPGL